MKLSKFRYLVVEGESKFSCVDCAPGQFQGEIATNKTSCTKVDLLNTYTDTVQYLEKYVLARGGPFVDVVPSGGFSRPSLTAEATCTGSNETGSQVPLGHYGCFDVDVNARVSPEGATKDWLTMAMLVRISNGLFCPAQVPGAEAGTTSPRFCRRKAFKGAVEDSGVTTYTYQYRCCGVRHKEMYVAARIYIETEFVVETLFFVSGSGIIKGTFHLLHISLSHSEQKPNITSFTPPCPRHQQVCHPGCCGRRIEGRCADWNAGPGMGHNQGQRRAACGQNMYAGNDHKVWRRDRVLQP